MSRKQRVARLQSAEAALADRCVLLQQTVAARRDDLRRLHPAWLLAGGFVSGVIVHRGGAWLGYSGLVSSMVPMSLRLWRLASGHLLSALNQANP